MTDVSFLHGHCLCGAVRFTARPERREMNVCHCGMCRRWTGGVLMSVRCQDTVEIEDDRQLGIYITSEWGERCFCKVCGTTLFWRGRSSHRTSVSAQAFDDPSIFEFAREIYFDEKPANYAFANATRHQTGAEVEAKYRVPNG